MDKETKNMFDEVLRTIKTGFDEVTDQFSHVNHQIGEIKTDISKLKTDVSGLKADVSELKIDVSGLKADVSGLKAEIDEMKQDISSNRNDMQSIKSTMVTKDYLDEKISDLRGDLVVMIRKEDNKVHWLGNMMKKKKIISAAEHAEFEKLEPFARS